MDLNINYSDSFFLALWLHLLCCFFAIDLASCVRLPFIAIFLPKQGGKENLAELPFGTGIRLLLQLEQVYG